MTYSPILRGAIPGWCSIAQRYAEYLQTLTPTPREPEPDVDPESDVIENKSP